MGNHKNITCNILYFYCSFSRLFNNTTDNVGKWFNNAFEKADSTLTNAWDAASDFFNNASESITSSNDNENNDSGEDSIFADIEGKFKTVVTVAFGLTITVIICYALPHFVKLFDFFKDRKNKKGK